MATAKADGSDERRFRLLHRRAHRPSSATRPYGPSPSRPASTCGPVSPRSSAREATSLHRPPRRRGAPRRRGRGPRATARAVRDHLRELPVGERQSALLEGGRPDAIPRGRTPGRTPRRTSGRASREGPSGCTPRRTSGHAPRRTPGRASRGRTPRHAPRRASGRASRGALGHGSRGSRVSSGAARAPGRRPAGRTRARPDPRCRPPHDRWRGGRGVKLLRRKKSVSLDDRLAGLEQAADLADGRLGAEAVSGARSVVSRDPGYGGACRSTTPPSHWRGPRAAASPPSSTCSPAPPSPRWASPARPPRSRRPRSGRGRGPPPSRLARDPPPPRGVDVPPAIAPRTRHRRAGGSSPRRTSPNLGRPRFGRPTASGF